MASFLSLLDIALLAFASILLRKLLSKKSAPLPPGPPKLPLLGNFVDFPSSQPWFTFAEWGEKWGDIVSVSVFGQQMIILNSAKQAIEMLDKKSSIYSDRPIVPMGGELIGWKNAFLLLPYGERLRNFRKLFHRTVGTQTDASKFHPVEEIETRRFLKRILANPNDLAAHVRKTAGAVILRISHGYQVQEKNDPLIALADEAMQQFLLSTEPGHFLVNLVPLLQHVPAWFPGGDFKKTAAEWAHTLKEMVEQPHQFVKQQMALGTAQLSFTSQLLESKDITPAEEFDIKWSAASLYTSGADTTVSAVYALFLAIVLHPEVARKAQKELDTVVGNNRLPTFADRENLPYTNALVLEVLRWHSVVPTGFPHRATEDDIYDGYLIPKGALVITNIWKMSHDPKIYADPFSFKPERFLGPRPDPDPRDVCFGFGRRECPTRICAGQVLAEASIFITSAMSLAVFDVTKSTVDGVVVEPKHEQTTGTVSHLRPFICSIRPRSQKAAELITDSAG